MDLDKVAGFSPSGPVAAKCLHSRARVRAIQGPYGSGKTVMCLHDGLLKAVAQPRSDYDGIRYLSGVGIADTYGSLERNTLRTWHQWFPKEWGHFKGAKDRPALHQLRFRDQWGEIRFDVDFMAVGDHAAEDVMDGYEPSWAFINGITRMNEDVLDYLLGRIGRGQSVRQLGPEAHKLKWYGILADLNPADMDHWAYQRLVINRPEKWELYVQPGGLLPDGRPNPDAENLNNLPEDYYTSKFEDWSERSPAKLRRFVFNEWGFVDDGELVFPGFGLRHRADHGLKYDSTRVLYVGLDGGQTLNPAAVFAQRNDEGQWRVLMELAPGRRGASAFADDLVRALGDNFPNARLEIYGDPTMDAGADKEQGQLSWLDTVEIALGRSVHQAPSNEFGVRQDAVAQALARTTHLGEPGLLVSKECPSLLAGFGGKYHYPRYKEGGQTKTRDRPTKAHPYSDLHDALQYIILSVEGLHSVTGGHSGRRWAEERETLDRAQKPPRGGEWGWSAA